MIRALRWLVLPAGALALAGCGGSDVAPGPPSGADRAAEVGPMLMRTAGAAGLVTQALPTPTGSASPVALHGSQINYMASRAMLDRVVFGSDRDGYLDIWVCDLDGSNLVQLTNNTDDDTLPEWSPDGTRIVFQRAWPGLDTEIIVMNAGGSGVTALTGNGIPDESPTWSPNGRSIFYHSGGTNFEVFRLFEDGSDPINLTNNVAGALSLYFSNETGRLVAVPVIRDSVYPSRAGAARALRHRAQDDGLVVEGDLAAIFDARGRRVAPAGARAVALAADGHISVLA